MWDRGRTVGQWDAGERLLPQAARGAPRRGQAPEVEARLGAAVQKLKLDLEAACLRLGVPLRRPD